MTTAFPAAVTPFPLRMESSFHFTKVRRRHQAFDVFRLPVYLAFATPLLFSPYHQRRVPYHRGYGTWKST